MGTFIFEMKEDRISHNGITKTKDELCNLVIDVLNINDTISEELEELFTKIGNSIK